MEVALAAFSAMGTTAATAATSAAAWAAGTTVTTAAGTVLSAGSSALSVMQGLATAGSMISTLVGGIGAMGEAQSNARMAELQGQQAYQESELAAVRIRREAVQKIGAARVAFAGSGLDISSAAAVENDLTAQANFETGIEEQNGLLRKAQAGMRASQYRQQGMYDMIGAAAKAGGQFANYGMDIAKRG